MPFPRIDWGSIFNNIFHHHNNGGGTATDLGGVVKVNEGSVKSSLDDDSLFIEKAGSFSTSIGRDVYSAGYLPMRSGPLLGSLGTAAPDRSAVLSGAEVAANHKSPVEKLDDLFAKVKGQPGTLTARYTKEGKRPEADFWWGFCDRWSSASLDARVAPYVNNAIYYKGTYFSTAELRGLASFLGRADEGSNTMFAEDHNVTPIGLEKVMVEALKNGGSGVIMDVYNDKKHGDYQVWNQAFDAVSQDVKDVTAGAAGIPELKGVDLSGGKKVYYVESTAKYNVEAGDGHEGAPTHGTRNWKYYIVTDASGKAVDGKWANASDEAPDYLWVPDRTGKFNDPSAAFFQDVIHGGVPAAKVQAFESTLDQLTRLGQPVSGSQKAELQAKYKGIVNAYPDAELDAKLKPLGLSAADFR